MQAQLTPQQNTPELSQKLQHCPQQSLLAQAQFIVAPQQSGPPYDTSQMLFISSRALTGGSYSTRTRDEYVYVIRRSRQVLCNNLLLHFIETGDEASRQALLKMDRPDPVRICTRGNTLASLHRAREFTRNMNHPGPLHPPCKFGACHAESNDCPHGSEARTEQTVLRSKPNSLPLVKGQADALLREIMKTKCETRVQASEDDDGDLMSRRREVGFLMRRVARHSGVAWHGAGQRTRDLFSALPQQLIISFSLDMAPESTFGMSPSDMSAYSGTPGTHQGHDNIGCPSSCVGPDDSPSVTLEEINLFLRYLETGDEASRVTLLKMGWADAQIPTDSKAPVPHRTTSPAEIDTSEPLTFDNNAHPAYHQWHEARHAPNAPSLGQLQFANHQIAEVEPSCAISDNHYSSLTTSTTGMVPKNQRQIVDALQEQRGQWTRNYSFEVSYYLAYGLYTRVVNPGLQNASEPWQDSQPHPANSPYTQMRPAVAPQYFATPYEPTPAMIASHGMDISSVALGKRRAAPVEDEATSQRLKRRRLEQCSDCAEGKDCGEAQRAASSEVESKSQPTGTSSGNYDYENEHENEDIPELTDGDTASDGTPSPATPIEQSDLEQYLAALGPPRPGRIYILGLQVEMEVLRTARGNKKAVKPACQGCHDLKTKCRRESPKDTCLRCFKKGLICDEGKAKIKGKSDVACVGCRDSKAGCLHAVVDGLRTWCIPCALKGQPCVFEVKG
ncbi:hypothetical protein CERSUDRAFT_69856 [Gelatoporia subvermispora B]|uniref:Zn(2)-C6 fungal-type domain-containing protein n=1 Tax=Ceriporiopsis subvermispora (strain B) TaxID=914234 RepID=M2RQT1_CERS8|nr:hypothetical protein CERSUDRAFT_69856 [Gelatoporia subvermispora B]